MRFGAETYRIGGSVPLVRNESAPFSLRSVRNLRRSASVEKVVHYRSEALSLRNVIAQSIFLLVETPETERSENASIFQTLTYQIFRSEPFHIVPSGNTALRIMYLKFIEPSHVERKSVSMGSAHKRFGALSKRPQWKHSITPRFFFIRNLKLGVAL